MNEQINEFRTGDGFYELKFSEAEMSDAFNSGFLGAIDRVLKITDKWEAHLSRFQDGMYVQAQKQMVKHFRSDVLGLREDVKSE